MPYEVTVKQVPPQHVAEVRRHTTVDAIGPVIGEAFRTLMTSMGRAHERPVGPPFVVYDRMDLPEHRAEIEVCVPVGYRFMGDDDVEVDEIPGGAVASTVHHGPYDAVGLPTRRWTDGSATTRWWWTDLRARSTSRIRRTRPTRPTW